MIFFACNVPAIGLPVASIYTSISLSKTLSKLSVKFIFAIVSLDNPLFRQFFLALSISSSIMESILIFFN